MNTRSIRFRLTLLYAGLVVAVVLGFGAYTYHSVDRYISLILTQSLGNRARQIGSTLLKNVNKTGEKYVSAEIQIRYAPELNDRFIRVTRPDYSVMYVSGPPNDKSFDPGEMPVVARTLSGLEARRERLPHGDIVLVTALPYLINNQQYLIETGMSESGTRQVLHRLIATLTFGLAVVVVVAIGGGYVLVKRALAPVQKMMRAAQEITIHHSTKRLPVSPTGDEIESLSLALNQMIARLDEAFQTTSRFTADASHELRTPLTIMRGSLEALLLRQSLPREVRDTLDSLLEETERLGKIVEGLSALSRLDAGEAQAECVRLDLADLATTTAEQMCLLAEEKSISLQCHTNGCVEVEGDRSRLKQVVVNLLDNAIKYTPAGGTIRLSVKAAQNWARLEVSDTGPGISEAALAHVFERFFRADEVRNCKSEGAGIGLSIVRSICSAHGGSVAVKNSPPSGCQFCVDLPLAVKS